VPFNTVPAPSAPWVNPGTYTVKLTVDGKSYSQPIIVKQDPRVKTPALVMQQVYTLTKSAYYGAIDAREAAQRAQSLRDQIAKLKPAAKGLASSALTDLEKKSDPAPLTNASAALSGVMNSLQNADVQPTTIQLRAITNALATSRAAMATWNAVKAVELPAVNLKLKAAHLTPLEVK
jgi:hypothetical protein